MRRDAIWPVLSEESEDVIYFIARYAGLKTHCKMAPSLPIFILFRMGMMGKK